MVDSSCIMHEPTAPLEINLLAVSGDSYWIRTGS